MIHPPEKEESQNVDHGNPYDSSLWRNVLVDLFLIPGMLREADDALREEMLAGEAV